MQEATPLTLRTSLASFRMNVWDERQQRLVSFRSVKGYGNEAPQYHPADVLW